MWSRQSPTGGRAPAPRSRTAWGVVLGWSMLGATAAHLMAFALLPAWKVTIPFTPGRSGMISLEPVVASGIHSPPAIGVVAPVAEVAAPEVDRLAADAERAEAAEPVIVPVPSIAEPAVSRPRAPRPLPQVATPPSTGRAQVASAAPAGLWRDILNPSQAVRFLRARYNPVLEATGARGYATIEVWVGSHGGVVHSEVHASSGQQALDAIALQLFDEVVRFEPRRGTMGTTLTSALVTISFADAW